MGEPDSKEKGASFSDLDLSAPEAPGPSMYDPSDIGLALSSTAPSPPPVSSLLSAPLSSPAFHAASVQAGFIRRAVAFMMDLFLISFLYLFIALFGILGISMASENSLGSWASLGDLAKPFFAAGLLFFTGYFTFFHAMEGQTPGKKILRIKVVREDGTFLSHPMALLRSSLGYFLSSSFLGFGFFMSLFGKKKRALHDWLTGSHVVLSEH